jgi:hypothetical protein
VETSINTRDSTFKRVDSVRTYVIPTYNVLVYTYNQCKSSSDDIC